MSPLIDLMSSVKKTIFATPIAETINEHKNRNHPIQLSVPQLPLLKNPQKLKFIDANKSSFSPIDTNIPTTNKAQLKYSINMFIIYTKHYT